MKRREKRQKCPLTSFYEDKMLTFVQGIWVTKVTIEAIIYLDDVGIYIFRLTFQYICVHILHVHYVDPKISAN